MSSSRSRGSRHSARSQIFGISVDALTMEEVLQMLHHSLISRTATTVGVVNAAKIVNLRSDTVLRESLLKCDVILADGQSVVWASKILGRPLPERIAGIDLFEQLLEMADRDRLSVYLLGAAPEVLERLCEEIAKRWPSINIVGSRDGYFPPDAAADVAAEIAASNADMLFLGMTSPKKENFLSAYGEQLVVPVRHGVGGSFDIFAGVTRRAPLPWQRFGLEWAYRVLQEPRRLWKRYLVTNTAFLALVARERLRPSLPFLRPLQPNDKSR